MQTLSKYEEPVSYRLRIEPNMKKFTFQGYEEVELLLKKSSSTILLNAKELKIREAYAMLGKERLAASVRLDKRNELAVLGFGKKLFGKVTLAISFEGINNDRMYGFYRSRYTLNGKEEYMLTTQFEPADARAAFPCIDEPDAKAIFELELVVDKEMDAISNMPAKSVVLENGKKRIVFYRTPRMATYLLYIGIGRFEYLHGNAGKIKIRVAATPGKSKLGKLALEFARKALLYYEKYFGINYPLPKVDLIAVPDFAAGAMENWGAITFREIDLLGDEKETPIAERQRIAEVVMHELTHQWFGDLVTMKWWDDLWLNESFATFMSYKAMGEIYPEWHMELEYAADPFGVALNADALRNTHPINVMVKTPAEVNSIFDEISYEKGGSVLHMLEAYAGKDVFRKGLHIYLSEHKYGNATKYDLWEAVEKAAENSGKKLRVPFVMKHWIDKPGYPIVIAKESGNGFELSQKRFLISGSVSAEPWPLPISYLSDKGHGSFLMAGASASIDAHEWIKLNYRLASLHRSSYPEALLEKLGKLIAEGKIDSLDAWSIVSDLFALARSGQIPAVSYARFVRGHCMDVGYPANAEVLANLNWLALQAEGLRPYEEINSLRIEFSKRIIARLGWERRRNEPTTDTKLRSAAIFAAGSAGDSATIARAQKLFGNGSRKNSIEASIRGSVYAIVAKNGDSDTFNTIKRLYESEGQPDEKIRLLRAMGYFNERKLISAALSYSQSERVRLQDSMYIPAVAFSTPAGKVVAWPWTKANWQGFMRKYSEGAHMLQRFVNNLSVLSDPASREDIAGFFASKGNTRADIKRAVRQALERIDANIKFANKNR